MARLRDIYLLSSLISMIFGSIAFANESLYQKFTDTELVAFKELQEFETSRSPLYFAGNMLPFLTRIVAGKATYKKLTLGSSGFQVALEEWRRSNPKATPLKAWDPSFRLPKMISTLMGLEYADGGEKSPFKSFMLKTRDDLYEIEKANKNTSFDSKFTGISSTNAFLDVANTILEIDKDNPKIKKLIAKVDELNISYRAGFADRLESKNLKLKEALVKLREDLVEERFKALRTHPKFKRIIGMLDPNGAYYKGNFRSKAIYPFARAERFLKVGLKLPNITALVSIEAKRVGGAVGGAIVGELGLVKLQGLQQQNYYRWKWPAKPGSI